MRNRAFKIVALLAPITGSWVACGGGSEHPTAQRPRVDAGAIEAGGAAARDGSSGGARDGSSDEMRDGAADSAQDSGLRALLDAASDADPQAPRPSPECAACVKTNCGIPYRVCQADPGCQALLACAETPAPGCNDLKSCLAITTTYAEARACVSQIAGDGGSLDYFAAVSVCASSACVSECPPAADAQSIAVCESALDVAEPQDAGQCADARACLCTRCTAELTTCFAEDACTRILGCLITSGCTGTQCLFACADIVDGLGGPTPATLAAELCMTRECAPCVPGGGGP